MGNNLRPGYGIVHRCVMEKPEISRDAKALYALLQSYTGASETCWPSLTTLAKCLSCTRMSIINWIEELEKNGLVLVKREQGKVNVYEPLVPKPVNVDLPPSQPVFTGTSQPALTQRLTVKKNKKKCADAHPHYQIVLDEYYRLFIAKSGSKPIIDGRVGKDINALLATTTSDEILVCLDRYFKNGYFFTKTGYSFSSFRSHYSEILSSIPKKQGDSKPPCPKCGKPADGYEPYTKLPWCTGCKKICMEVTA